jgi:hypothetical protein
MAADYREISQEYAQGGIKAALLINGGAAVALLSQAAELAHAGIADSATSAMIVWAFGVFAAAGAWLVAFMSTRYVDKSEREENKTEAHLKTADIFMNVGLGLIAASLICFLVGSISIAYGFGKIAE